MHSHIQDVDCSAGRGIARTTLTQLAAGGWIRQAINLIICGATGSGKTFVACALAHQACRQKQAVLYRRVPELIAELARVRDTARHDRLMRRLVKCNLLVLDDWGLQDFSTEGRRELMEIVEQRHERRPTLVASQIPVELWPKVIGEPTIADAILDRIVHNAYRIDLKGEWKRKRNKPPPSTAAATATEPRPDGRGPWAPAAPSWLRGRRGAAALPDVRACRRAHRSVARLRGLAYPRLGLATGQPPAITKGGGHKHIRERQSDGARPRRGQVLSDSRSSKIGNGGQVRRIPHIFSRYFKETSLPT